MKWLKKKLINWLLKDVEVEELIVKKLKVGDETVTIDANSITLPGLSADPALAAGKIWFRSDLGRVRYSPDGLTVIQLDPPATPADIWSYSPRTLTERFVVIERGRGYAPSATLLSREYRPIKAGTRFLIISDRNGAITTISDNILKNATRTILVTWTVTGLDNERDDSEATAMTVTVPAATATTDAIKYDLGSIVTGFIYLYITQDAYTRCVVSVSTDDVTYTTIFNQYVTSATAFKGFYYYGSVRYIKISLGNADTASARNVSFNSIEVYTPVNDRTFTRDTFTILNIFVNGYYQVLEVITI